MLILSFSCALYQTADVGIAPYDALSLLLARKLPVPYFWCRIFTDGVCVGVAFLLGRAHRPGHLGVRPGPGALCGVLHRYAAQAMVFGRGASRKA